MGFKETFLHRHGKLSDKWEQYLSIYDRELSGFVHCETPIDVLEIGTQNGGSLEVWSSLFPPGSTVIGVDVNPKVAELKYPPGIGVLVGNGSDVADIDEILGDRNFDIIIDDGSHRSSDIIDTFKNLFRRLRPGGLFIVEDLHCAYMTSYGGGLGSPTSAIEYLKSLVDALHVDYYENSSAIDPQELVRLKDLNGWIGRVAFYDSVCVIEKLSRQKVRPYRRVLSGEDGLVLPLSDYATIYPAAMLGDFWLSEGAAKALSPDQQRNLQTWQDRIAALDEELAQKRRDLLHCRAQLLLCTNESYLQRMTTALNEARADVDFMTSLIQKVDR